MLHLGLADMRACRECVWPIEGEYIASGAVNPSISQSLGAS